MTDLIVHNFDDAVRGKLQELASTHGHSVEDEVRDILRDAILVQSATAPDQGLGSRIAARFSGSGIGLTEAEADVELRGYNARPLEFDR